MPTSNYIDFWKEAISQIKNTLNEEGRSSEYDMWFLPLSYIDSKDTTITIAFPSLFMKENFFSRDYDKILVDKMKELTGRDFSFDHIVKAVEKPTSVNEAEADDNIPSKKVSKKAEKEIQKDHPDMNSAYTFDSFVTGDNNSFAYNAALAISKNAGKLYNPVLFYGGVGLGKTHLLQAIGNALHENGYKKIIYITAENFTNEFIWAIKDKANQKFVNKYRTADILLIDDIHFLQGKSSTQEELFHIFNSLYEANKQIVFTCDRPITELKDITERLKSRFGRGLNVDLLPPQYETRIAILEKKLDYLRTQISPKIIDNIPKEVLNIIAQNIETNVRDLESCLTTIIAYAELTGTTLTEDITYNQLRDKFSAPQQGNVSIDIIQRVVAEEYNISISDIKGKTRKKNIVFARQIAMYIAQNLTEYSTTELGLEFGNKDHTTVMHSCKKIENDIKNDSKLDYKIQGIMKTIKDYKRH